MTKNIMVFKNRDQANGLLKWLLDYNQSFDDNEKYNDIHIYQEEDYITIEWVNVPYSHHYGGKFEYVDEDQVVMKEFVMPDNAIVYFEADEEYNEFLNKWLEDHKTWKKDVFGRWYDSSDLEDLDKN